MTAPLCAAATGGSGPRDPRKAPTPGVPGDPCVLAGHGDDFAVAGLGNDPDGGIPMTGVLPERPAWTTPRMTAGPGKSASWW